MPLPYYFDDSIFVIYVEMGARDASSFILKIGSPLRGLSGFIQSTVFPISVKNAIEILIEMIAMILKIFFLFIP